jgi:hypothetical protein
MHSPVLPTQSREACPIVSTIEQPAEPKKTNLLKTIALLSFGLIGIVLGVAQIQRGIKEITGAGRDPELQRLLVDSDKAVDDANKLMQDVAPLFQQLLDEVDKVGLDLVHQQKQELAQQVSEKFEKASVLLHTAAKELDEAVQHKVADKYKAFLADKSLSYRLTADACDRNREIVTLVMDKSIDKLEVLMPKIESAAAKREEAQKAAAEASAKAEEAAK